MLTSQAMDLSSALAPLVASEVRRRGEAYLREGRVRIVDHGKDFVSATVSGTQLYEVDLERTSRSLAVSCTCPYYERDFDTCKHIWAAVLAAGAQGYLLSSAGKPPRRIEPADAEPWDLDGVDDFDTDADPWAPSPAGAAHRSGARPSPVPAPPSRFQRLSERPAGWRDHLERLAAEALSSPPPIEDLHYVLDLRATAKSGTIVLELLERSRKASGDWGKFRRLKLDRAHITPRLTSSIDRQILALLAGARPHLAGSPGWQAWQNWRAYDPVPALSEVPDALLAPLLPLLCASGRARLWRDPQEGEGPPLAWGRGRPVDAGPGGRARGGRGRLLAPGQPAPRRRADADREAGASAA